MKKLLIISFIAFFLTACDETLEAPATSETITSPDAPSTLEILSYSIDEWATDNAPWKVGEKIIEEEKCYDGKWCYREFLGITKSGQIVVQQFYRSRSAPKLTDPFLVNLLQAAEMPFNSELFMTGIDGKFVAWYSNGQKMNEWVNINGQPDGLMAAWHENGKKMAEHHYKAGNPVGVWRNWHKSGNLAYQTDYGTPAD